MYTALGKEDSQYNSDQNKLGKTYMQKDKEMPDTLKKCIFKVNLFVDGLQYKWRCVLKADVEERKLV